MFRHLMKSLLWQFGRLPLLFFLFIVIGRINTSVAVKSTSNEENAATQIDDYDSYDNETIAPAEQNQPKGPKPFFDKTSQTIYLGSANKTQINCSAKNFDDVKHSILWYKDNNVLVNGNFIMNNEYKIDSNKNLIIEHVTENTPGTYTCQITPFNVNQTTILKSGDDPNKPNPSGASAVTITVAIAMQLPVLAFIGINSMYSFAIQCFPRSFNI